METECGCIDDIGLEGTLSPSMVSAVLRGDIPYARALVEKEDVSSFFHPLYLIVAKRSYYGWWLTHSDYVALLDHLDQLCNALKTGDTKPWGCLIIEPFLSPSDWEAISSYENVLFTVSAASPETTVKLVNARYKRLLHAERWMQELCGGLQQEATGSEGAALPATKLHLAYRLVLAKEIGTQLCSAESRCRSWIRHRLSRIWKGPEWFFEHYLQSAPIHQSGVIATECALKPDNPERHTQGMVLAHVRGVLPEFRPLSEGWLILNDTLDSFWQAFLRALRSFFARQPYGWQTRVLYDSIQSLVSRSMLFVDRELALASTARVLESSPLQRQELLSCFRFPRDDEGSISLTDEPCGNGFPRWFKARYHAFREGKEEFEFFSPGWEARLVQQSLDKNSTAGIDSKVLFALSVLDFIYPEMRRTPPYATWGESARESRCAAYAYRDFMQQLEVFFADSCSNRVKLYLSTGTLIKAVFRYRGRREMLGRRQKIAYSVQQSKRRKVAAGRLDETKALIADQAQQIRASELGDFSRGLFEATVDHEGYQAFAREWRGIYDGPFFVARLLAPDQGQLLESVVSCLLSSGVKSATSSGTLPIRIVGVGRKGSIPGSLLALLLNAPFSSVTLRPGFDESPRIPGSDRILVIDDSVKTGFTLLNIVEHFKAHTRRAKSQDPVAYQALCLLTPIPTRIPDNSELLEQYNALNAIATSCRPLLSCSINGRAVQQNSAGSTALSLSESHVEAIKAFFQRRVADSKAALSKLGKDELAQSVRQLTHCGWPNSMEGLGAEFYSRAYSITSTAENLICRFARSETSQDTVRWFARGVGRTLWEESGAKYKPSRLFNHPEVLWQVAAYYHGHFESLSEADRPNVLVVNSRLAVPLSVAICLHKRYAADESNEGYHILLAGESGKTISGLSQLLHKWPAAKRQLRVASVTNMTAHGEFECEVWDTLVKEVAQFNQAHPSVAFEDPVKVATCSLFNLAYAPGNPLSNGMSGQMPPYLGQFLPLVELPVGRAKPSSG